MSKKTKSNKHTHVMEVSKLLKQLETNQKHERHYNYNETMYWCKQWRLLAEQLAQVIKDVQEKDK